MPDIVVSGPYFDHPLRDHAVTELCRDARDEVGKQALADWHGFLDTSIRHPTPYYETQPVMQERGGAAVVHDRGIVYGPWLEGVGSRNKSDALQGLLLAAPGRGVHAAEGGPGRQACR
jgi:hypothetical protein